jgi:hypothetical protein
VVPNYRTSREFRDEIDGMFVAGHLKVIYTAQWHTLGRIHLSDKRLTTRPQSVGRDVPLLLVPERCHRINPASSACRNPAGQGRDAQQNRGDTEENREVERAVRNRVKGNHEGE